MSSIVLGFQRGGFILRLIFSFVLFLLLFLGRPSCLVMFQRFYDLIISIEGMFLALARGLWGWIRWLGESSISIGKFR